MRRVLPFLLAVACVGGCASLPGATPVVPPTETWAFTAPWDPRSAASLRANAASLHAAVTGWFALDTLSGQVTTPYADHAVRSAAFAGTRLAMVTTFAGGRFRPETIRLLAGDSGALRGVSRDIARRARAGGYAGLVLDLEDVPRADSLALQAVAAGITSAAHDAGVAPVMIALPATDSLSYPARRFPAVDLFLVMLYDQHWATSAPGPIAEPEWARRVLASRVAEIGAGKILAGLPLYGYRWRAGEAFAETIGWHDAGVLSAAAGVPLERDAGSLTLHASNTAGQPWELWVSDGVLVDALTRVVREAGVWRVALWRLGLEDPATWRQSALRPMAAPP